ncbi:hypothetical protein FACS1894132_08000 [Clostridia bacterium]|nr:hypothetical protein FACS1894132_08000 [Clostridia bacterium]
MWITKEHYFNIANPNSAILKEYYEDYSNLSLSTFQICCKIKEEVNEELDKIPI